MIEKFRTFYARSLSKGQLILRVVGLTSYIAFALSISCRAKLELGSSGSGDLSWFFMVAEVFEPQKVKEPYGTDICDYYPYRTPNEKNKIFSLKLEPAGLITCRSTIKEMTKRKSQCTSPVVAEVLDQVTIDLEEINPVSCRMDLRMPIPKNVVLLCMLCQGHQPKREVRHGQF